MDLLKLALLAVSIAYVIIDSDGVRLADKQKDYIVNMVTKFVNSNGECSSLIYSTFIIQ